MPILRRSPRIAAKLSKVKKIKTKLQSNCAQSNCAQSNCAQSGYAPRRSARLAAKRRGKPNTDFVKHRPTVLDKLPMDIIHQIFVHLDYETRINLNQCLPIWDRISRKMDKNLVAAHDFRIRTHVLANILFKLNSNIDPIIGNDRLQLLIKLFKTFQNPLYFMLILHFPNLRVTILEKSKEIETSTENEIQTVGFSEVEYAKLISEVNTLKIKIDKSQHSHTTALTVHSVKSSFPYLTFT